MSRFFIYCAGYFSHIIHIMISSFIVEVIVQNLFMALCTFSSNIFCYFYTRALLLNIPGMFIIISLCSLTGLVLYAKYADCDPLSTKMVGNPNQVITQTVEQLLRHQMPPNRLLKTYQFHKFIRGKTPLTRHLTKEIYRLTKQIHTQQIYTYTQRRATAETYALF